MKRIRKIVLGTALAAIPALPVAADELIRNLEQATRDATQAVEWRELICTPVAGLQCGATSCNQRPARARIQLKRTSPLTGTISRCDNRGCDEYVADISTGGLFTSLQPQIPRGYLIKVLGSREFVEAQTLGLDVLLSSGACARTQ